MAEAKKLNEVYNFNKKPVGEATVFCGDGICSLDTDQEMNCLKVGLCKVMLIK